MANWTIMPTLWRRLINTPYSLTRDLAGRITKRVENIGGEMIIWDYGYDAVGKLIEVKKKIAVFENYSYDANGNRLTDNNRSYSYSNEDYVLTAGTDTYQFNVDGFLTQKTTASGTTTYNYSSRGELIERYLAEWNNCLLRQ